jgi:hypothetical protein
MLKKIRSARLVERARTFRRQTECHLLWVKKTENYKKNFAIKKEIEKKE